MPPAPGSHSCSHCARLTPAPRESREDANSQDRLFVLSSEPLSGTGTILAAPSPWGNASSFPTERGWDSHVIDKGRHEGASAGPIPGPAGCLPPSSGMGTSMGKPSLGALSPSTGGHPLRDPARWPSEGGDPQHWPGWEGGEQGSLRWGGVLALCRGTRVSRELQLGRGKLGQHTAHPSVPCRAGLGHCAEGQDQELGRSAHQAPFREIWVPGPKQGPVR